MTREQLEEKVIKSYGNGTYRPVTMIAIAEEYGRSFAAEELEKIQELRTFSSAGDAVTDGIIDRAIALLRGDGGGSTIRP